MTQQLFVCGFPGGGTDLSKLVLNAHPEIELSGELPLLRSLADHGYHAGTTFTDEAQVGELQELLRRLDTWGNLSHLDRNFAGELSADEPLALTEVLRRCSVAGEQAVWGNKTPQNTEHITALAALFPDAKFLVVTRDVRDIAVSWREKWGRYEPTAAARWNDRMLRGKRAGEAIGTDRVLWVRFEDLLADVGSWAAEVCRFLGIEVSERMLHHADYVDRELDGKRNYGRPVIRNNTGRWSDGLSDDTARRIEEIAWPAMSALGYEPVHATGPVPLTPTERYRGYGSDALAAITVGNRARENNSLPDRVRSLIDLVRRRWLIR